jgi:hypothetical protein
MVQMRNGHTTSMRESTKMEHLANKTTIDCAEPNSWLQSGSRGAVGPSGDERLCDKPNSAL